MAISIGDALLKIGVDTRGVDKGLQGLGNKLKKHQKAIGLGILAAGGAIVAAGAMSVKAYAKMGDEVGKMAKRTGFSTEALSELRHAAEISGSSLGSLEKGVKKMAMSVSDAKDGLATYTREFDKIGVSIEELEGLNPEEQFFRIAEAIASLEDPTQRAASAQKILGRAGTELLPLFAEGTEGMAALRKEAHELGIVFDEEAAKKAEDFTDALTRLNKSIDGVKFAIADALIPVLEPLIEQVTDATKDVGSWVKENKELAQTVAMGGVLMMGLGGLLLILPKLKMAVIALSGALRTLMLSPITMLISGLAMLGYGIYAVTKHHTDWNKIVEASTKFNESLEKTQGKVNDKVIEAAKEYIALREAYGQIRPEEITHIQNLRDMIASHEEYQVKLVEWKENIVKYHKAVREATSEADAEVIKGLKGRIELQEEELDLLRQRTIIMLEQYEWDKRYLRLEEERQKMLRGESNLYGELLIDYYEAIKARVAMGVASEKETRWLAANGKAMMDYMGIVEQQTSATLTKTGAMEEQTTGVKKLTDAELGLESATKFVASAFSSATDAMKGWTVAYDYITGKKYLHPPERLTKGAWKTRAEKLYPEEQVAAYKEAFGEDWERRITWYGPTEGVTVEQARLAREFGREHPAGGPTGMVETKEEWDKAFKEYEQKWEGLGKTLGEHPYYEQGGIAMRPVLAHIAEKSPEAVIPLDKLGKMFGVGRSVNIYVELDGRTIARTIGQPLVDEIRVRQGLRI